jgi:hypothetical protein
MFSRHFPDDVARLHCRAVHGGILPRPGPRRTRPRLDRAGTRARCRQAARGGGCGRSLTLPNLARNFRVYDRNADGILNAGDNPLSPLVPGDLDDDGQLDVADALRLIVVLLGPEITTPPASQPQLGDFLTTDLDVDADVDLADFARFQRGFTGGP